MVAQTYAQWPCVRLFFWSHSNQVTWFIHMGAQPLEIASYRFIFVFFFAEFCILSFDEESTYNEKKFRIIIWLNYVPNISDDRQWIQKKWACICNLHTLFRRCQSSIKKKNKVNNYVEWREPILKSMECVLFLEKNEGKKKPKKLHETWNSWIEWINFYFFFRSFNSEHDLILENFPKYPFDENVSQYRACWAAN